MWVQTTVNSTKSSQFELSPEQQRVLETWGQGLSVMAGAGSGKTTTLVSKCLKLVEKNSEARFAAVSFTERSASDLRAKLSTGLLQLGSQGLHPHWVMTIHGLCGSLIREYPRAAGFDGEEVILSEYQAFQLWENAIEALWLDSLPKKVQESFEHLLDRESQDGVARLLLRVRELSSFGVLKFLKMSEDLSSRALECTAQFVLDRYARLKRRQGVLDFYDLERGAHQALQSHSVQQAYHRRFELILIDEFQDTNPLQAEILWKMARPQGTNLVVVGDPKQSIYRFRDADVSVFQEYCDKLPLKQSLTWNFRSLPGIIQFANQVCEPIFKSSGIEFEALVPVREKKDFESVVRLEILNPGDLADWILSEVQRGVPLDEMVVLLRKIRGNEKWIQALASRGIPIAIGSGGLFWEDPRVRELTAFLRWWSQPGHSLSGAIFLRAPWVGIPDIILDQWVRQDPTWRIPFFSSTYPLAEVLKPFQGRIVRPGELLLALLEGSQLPQIADELGAPLLALWHRVEELSAQGLDFQEVVQELSIALKTSRREREVPAPRNRGQLSILTIHGSKGLEFSQVILVDLGPKARASEMPLLFWDRAQGAYLGQRDENGDRDRGNLNELDWRELESKKNLAESKRLFYVALTRAKERLILVCPPSWSLLDDSEKRLVPEDAREQDHWGSWVNSVSLPSLEVPQSNSLFYPALQVEEKESIYHSRPSTRLSGLHCQGAVGMTRARHSVTEWTLLSVCPRAYEWKFVRPVECLDRLNGVDEEEAESKDRVADSELGSRVHQALERKDEESLYQIEKEVGGSRFQAAPLIDWARSSPLMVETHLERGREVWSELFFEVPIRGEVLVGSIDRLILQEKERKQFSVVDFKVTEKPKSMGVLLRAYQTQMDLYAWALTLLEPGLKQEDLSAQLVHICTEGVQVVSVPLGRISGEVLLDQALKILNGATGIPKPGPRCRFCEFRSLCPEALLEAQI